MGDTRGADDLYSSYLQRLTTGTDIILSLLPPKEEGKDLYLNQINGQYFNSSNPIEATPLHLSPASYLPYWAGFLAGRLWLLYDLTGKTIYLENAKDITDRISHLAESINVDTGFAIYHSACLGFQATGDNKYIPIIQKGSASLADLYVDSIGLLMVSLPNRKHTEQKLLRRVREYEALIDTGEVLDLLWFAGKFDSKYKDIAYSNMKKTLEMGFIKNDGSTYQCLTFDSESMKPKEFFTRQGYSTNSVWSRGQAWAMISLANAYEITGEDAFLEAAVLCSDWYVGHLPEDFIPFYDFNDPYIPNVARDTSAATIAICALSLLSKNDSTLAKKYKPTILKTLEKLMVDYLSPGGILMGGSWGRLMREHPNEVVMPYGNYYLVEALYREIKPGGVLLHLG